MRGQGDFPAQSLGCIAMSYRHCIIFHFNGDFDDCEETDLCKTMLSVRVLNFRTRKFADVQETRKSSEILSSLGGSLIA